METWNWVLTLSAYVNIQNFVLNHLHMHHNLKLYLFLDNIVVMLNPIT